MDKLKQLRDRIVGKAGHIDKAEALLIALEVMDVASAITAAMTDGQIDVAEAAKIGREVADLRAVLSEAMAD